MAEVGLIAESPPSLGLSTSFPELAVSAVNPISLSRIGSDKPSRFAFWQATLDDFDLAEWLSGFAPTHCYVGSEFCEHLLPGIQVLRRALNQVQDSNCRISLMTPIASPQVVRALGDLLPCLPDGSEVIVNDWGVARLVKERFPMFRLIAGRLLCRMMKDPRLGNTGAITQCGFDPRPLRAMFAHLGVFQMEIDVPMFVDVGTFSALPMRTGVHLPYSCVAKGRMCRIGSISFQGAERFAVGRKCKRECLGVSARLERPGAIDDLCTYQVGNSIVSKHSKEMLDVVKMAVERGLVSRLIVQGESI